MRRQKNRFQTKEEDKTRKELRKVEIGNLPKKEFRVVTVKIIQDLSKNNAGTDRKAARNA